MARLHSLELREAPRRFSDDAFSYAQAPTKEHVPGTHGFIGSTCPFCNQQVLPARTSITSQFGGGVRRLVLAIVMIVGAMCRCLRFVAGGVFCLVGLIGYCCRAIGLRIVHPEDRRLLTRHRRSTSVS